MNTVLHQKLSLTEIEKILISFSVILMEEKTEDKLLWRLVKNCISVLEFEGCAVYLVDDEKQILTQKAAYGSNNQQDKQVLSPIEIPVGTGISGYVALTGESLNVSDTSTDGRYVANDMNRSSVLGIPIKIEGQTIGVINCEHSEKNAFSDQHVRILSAIASILAIKICSLRSELQLKEQKDQSNDVEKQLMELKSKVLKSQMNPHFVFNALNAIQFFLTKSDKKSALSYLGLFSKVIRHYLTTFEEDYILVSSEVQALQWYLELQKLRYADRFTYEIQSNQKNLSEKSEQYLPPLVIFALVENVVENKIGSTLSLHAYIKLNISKEKVTLTLHFNSSDKTGSSGYRKHLITWEDYILRLNKLRNYRILKEIHKKKTDDVDLTIVKLTIPTINAEAIHS